MRLMTAMFAIVAAVLLLAWAGCQLNTACRAGLPEHDMGDPPITWPRVRSTG